MKGFVAGSLGLIVLYVVLQRGSSNNIESGGSLVVAFLRRATSPEVAGVPKRGSSSLGPKGGSYGSDPPQQPTPPPTSPGVPVWNV